jgi:hypothetical protein
MKFELRLIAIASLLILLIAAACQRQCIAEIRRGIVPWERESLRTRVLDAPGARDFDFLTGYWEVSNRRLKKRHAGSTEWDEFPGRSSVRRS